MEIDLIRKIHFCCHYVHISSCIRCNVLILIEIKLSDFLLEYLCSTLKRYSLVVESLIKEPSFGLICDKIIFDFDRIERIKLMRMKLFEII